ncbi:glycosyl hydrolase family 43 [Pedobacter psychrophilus]|uniref:Glycosyl hydrolase family 43 n=1 Tax=Pedobacter psychrophilus TaxID=1826909 RepID=A0A179DGY3_9SPHI|nr:family 43 glycosylhydrolase [Pedobacter psychrophilus]OAQ40325.1 glycosyl hydrolase family 43 [Pedobacter psychrophilus]
MIKISAWIYVCIITLIITSISYRSYAQAINDSFSDPNAPIDDTTLTVPQVVKPILDVWMRDTYIMRAPDGYYYMTGTVNMDETNKDKANSKDYNTGVRLWKSTDLKNWIAMGEVWSFIDDGADWQKRGKPLASNALKNDAKDEIKRALWAPELHYIKSKKKWLIAACMNNGNGSFVLESISGKPEGPYRNIEGCKDKPIFNQIDLGIFEDTDGEVYLIGHNHFIAKMKDDLSDIEEPFKRIEETPYQPEPYIEGVFIVKHHNKYQLLQTVWSVPKPGGGYTYLRPKDENNVYSYDVIVAESDHIYGPYGKRYPAILQGGHNNLFQDDKNEWWSTTFFNPRGIMGAKFPVTCRPAIVPVKWENNKLRPDLERANLFYGK